LASSVSRDGFATIGSQLAIRVNRLAIEDDRHFTLETRLVVIDPQRAALRRRATMGLSTEAGGSTAGRSASSGSKLRAIQCGARVVQGLGKHACSPNLEQT
jgi:hypothetical protein